MGGDTGHLTNEAWFRSELERIASDTVPPTKRQEMHLKRAQVCKSTWAEARCVIPRRSRSHCWRSVRTRRGPPIGEATVSKTTESIFGPTALFEGEDAKAYDELLSQIATVLKPADVIGDFLVRDVMDLTWEIFRLRRLKAKLMMANAYKGLSELLVPIIGASGAQDLAEAWTARSSDAVERVNKILASAGLNTEAVIAQTLSLKLDDIERIDHLIALAEARRNAALREIDRHQQTLGQQMRHAVVDVEDGHRLIESTPASIDPSTPASLRGHAE
jgi:hypothetical protein